MSEIVNTKSNKGMTMVEWLLLLLEYAKGEKEWNTGEVWVCESHPCTPFEAGTKFDCQCNGPGMPPYTPTGDK